MDDVSYVSDDLDSGICGIKNCSEPGIRYFINMRVGFGSGGPGPISWDIRKQRIFTSTVLLVRCDQHSNLPKLTGWSQSEVTRDEMLIYQIMTG